MANFTRHLAVLTAFMAALCGAYACRATDPSRADSDLDALADKPWFDYAGKAATCDSPASQCDKFDDDKDFIDKCVAAGYQAKTCGCAIRCSGKIAMPPRPQTTAAGSTETAGCPEASVRLMDDVVAAMGRSNNAFKCATGHICAGHTVYCAGALKESTVKIRRFAARRCRDVALERFCPDQFVESLGCQEADIDRLSAGWKAAFQGDAAVSADIRRCYQGLLCNGVASKCDAKGLERARSLKTTLEKDGCEYWLKNFCSLGNQGL
jgi:hypothetical protein